MQNSNYLACFQIAHLNFPANSDGMGRSGVFICAMSEVERVKVERQVDVFQTIKGMRIQRPHMVDTPVSVCVCVCACVYVHAYVCMCVVCVYIHTLVCLYILYAHMCVSSFICDNIIITLLLWYNHTNFCRTLFPHIL